MDKKPGKGTEMTNYSGQGYNPYVAQGYNAGYAYPQQGMAYNAAYGTPVAYPSNAHVYQSQPLKEDYYAKKIENQLIKRTEAAGSTHAGFTEFDDYFEKHIEKFFTPEIDEIYLYHYQGYIFGLQFMYRDSWGKTSKETYKGELHMANNVDKKNCECAKIKFPYDEYVKQIFVEANEYVTFLKFVTNKGNTLEVGHQANQDLKPIVSGDVKVLGIGGTFNTCLNSVYFYCS